MGTKRKFHSSRRELTHYSSSFSAKMRNTAYLENSLAVGSKNRLSQYRKNLAVTRGFQDPEIDYQLLDLLRQYVINSNEFEAQIRYLMSLKDLDGNPFSRNLKIYNTTEEAMVRFSEKDYTSFRWNENYRKSLKELKSEFSRLNLKPLVFKCDDHIKDALPKKDTHSGYTWILSGLKKKGENMEGIHRKFKHEMREAIKIGSFNKPILIGFRTQASGEYKDDGSQTNTCKHKLRVVSMIDLIQIIGELKFSKPIQDYLSTVPYYAGGKSEKAISSIITGNRMKYDRFLSIDYSSFDQTISSWLIEDAFSIIRTAFKDISEEESALFDVIVHDFIHKDFILNEGVLHSDKGVPSGSMFTQIIDSIVNVLVIKTYFHHLKSSCDMITMGDDNAIFTNATIHLEDLSSYLSKNFGLIVKTDDKSSEGLTKHNNVKFLSRYWTWHGEWRHPNQLISRMIFPERHRNYDNVIGPEHVLFAFLLTYRLGVEKLIDSGRFTHDYPISKRFILDKVDSRYLPGALAFIREYT